MSQFSQRGKKIVSKGKYVQVQSARLGVGFAGMGLMFAAVAGLMLTIYLFMLVIGAFIISLVYWTWMSWAFALLITVAALLTGVGTRLLWKFGTVALDKTDTMNNVVPFTRSTLSDVPAPDILVRASEETPVAPETILLRAVADYTTTPPEQLVRPSATPEQNAPKTV